MKASNSPRYSQPMHICNILHELTRENSKALFSPESMKIFNIWSQVVNEEISRHTKPILFKNGKLVLMVVDPIWRNELNFLKTSIITSLNKALGKKMVRCIELTLYNNYDT